jgi:hypothetical protein
MRCRAITKSWTQCRNNTEGGKWFCHVHRGWPVGATLAAIGFVVALCAGLSEITGVQLADLFPTKMVTFAPTIQTTTAEATLPIETATLLLPTPEVFKITGITFEPPPPSNAENIKIFSCTQGHGGVGITLKVSINTSPDGTDTGDWIIVKELGVPCFRPEDAPVWNTSTWLTGTYLVKVEAKGPDNQTWDEALNLTTTYQLQKP